ncbi:MAG: alpha/beta hydrolase [Actinomycetota bacterium]|nr:alpha/beta hydrolase [Actinomycetota bacterium]
MPSQISPHCAERVDLPVPGGHLAALRSAPRGAGLGAVALLVPGYTGSKEDFAPLLDPLAAAGLHAVAVDLPGQYESPGPGRESDHLPNPLGRTLAALVTDLAARHRVLLLGHSYGGLVARGAVLAGAPICGLTLLGSGPGALPPGPRRAALELAEPILRAHGIEAVQAFRESRYPAVAEPAELAGLLRARFLGSSVPGLLGMATALCGEPDRVHELAAALGATPCLVACGQADDAWPVEAQRDMAHRLGAQFALIPGAAHSPNIENPVGLLAALLPNWRRWLGDRTVVR